DTFQIRKPPATGEMRRHIAGKPRRAAGEGDDPVDAELAGKPDGVAQRGVMGAGDVAVWMERITPAVEGSDFEASSLDLLLRCPASGGLLEQPRHVAVACGRVGTGADLEPADFGRLRDHPVHDLAERLACQRLRYQTDLEVRGSHGCHNLERSKPL